MTQAAPADASRTRELVPTADGRIEVIVEGAGAGWHPQASEAQRLAGLATRQAEWWSAGDVPLLDLQADNDPFHPIDKMSELKDELGDRVTVAVIRDASHALLPEQPAAVVAAIVTWIRRL